MARLTVLQLLLLVRNGLLVLVDGLVQLFLELVLLGDGLFVVLDGGDVLLLGLVLGGLSVLKVLHRLLQSLLLALFLCEEATGQCQLDNIPRSTTTEAGGYSPFANIFSSCLTGSDDPRRPMMNRFSLRLV